MATFRYEAIDRSGQPRSGSLDADTVSLAVMLLEQEGCTVLSISQTDIDRSPFAEPIPAAEANLEQSALERHMDRVVEQGRIIAPALQAYSEELPAGPRRRQLETVLKVLDRGDAAEATAALRSLPAYWIPLLSAASASRDPGRVLSEFLQESQQAEDLRRQWWLTLIYPLLLLGIAATVLVVLSFLVVPVFREIFIGFDLPLPSLTRFVFAVAEGIASGRILVAAVVLLILGYLLIQSRRLLPRSFREAIDDRFGTPLRRATALARLTRFVADLLEADLDVPTALRIAGFAVESSRLRRAAWRLAMALESHQFASWKPYRPFLSATVLHGLTGNMTRAARIRLLREVSANYADRVRYRLSWTRGVVEPSAIVLIGVVVGGTVIALFMPLFHLIHGLSGG
jgi:type IV pilus assembly protein PilC